VHRSFLPPWQDERKPFPITSAVVMFLPEGQNAGMRKGRPRSTPPASTNLVLQHRLDRGWSQERLAELSGLSGGQVQRIETGKRSLSQRSLHMLAKAFGVAPRELLPPEHAAAEAGSSARLARLQRELRPEQLEALLVAGEAMLPKAGEPDPLAKNSAT
jgi:transcriptional regulator with XRE-family HTH domain